MLNIGRAMILFNIETPVVVVDANGAPYSTWGAYASVYAEIENSEVQSTESNQTGTRRDMAQSMTLVCRCHPQQSFTPNMRAVRADTGDIYAIMATRMDMRKTTAYLDVVAGSSDGGVP